MEPTLEFQSPPCALALDEEDGFLVAAVGQEVARLRETAQDFAVLTEAVDDLAAVGVLFAKPGELRRLTVDPGVGEGALQLFRALLDLPQLVKQHRGSPGDGPARPAVQLAVIVWRLYFRWNRSTRPAVSMNFCLPV